MKRSFLSLSGVLLALGGVAVWWVKFDPQPPTVVFQGFAEVVGQRAAWTMVVQTAGRPGLRHIEVRLRVDDRSHRLFAEEVEPISWIGSRLTQRRVHIEVDLAAIGAPDGPGQLEVFADTYAWHVIPQRHPPRAVRTVTIDVTPPGVQLISRQHNLQLGGSSVAVFRVTPDTVRAGVAVHDYFFPGVRGIFADQHVAVAVFAVPENLTKEVRPLVRAIDGVGNARDVALPSRIRDRRFPTRHLTITDRFLDRKVAEILAANGLPVPDDLVKGYLQVNRDLRRESERRIRTVTAASIDSPLWDGPFRRQSNAARMSGFADRRAYVYRGETIDQQTHLGCDLASVKHAAVEATQNGVVVLAGDMGIYGRTVILDHGLGVSSLYGHLSTITVEVGQRVKTGETLGHTGTTGLAGGDHLHFSIMLGGIHVDPVEWWDPKWIRDHVTAKLTLLPAAANAARRAAASSAAPEVPPDGQARP